MAPYNRTAARRAFTLVELLVVITIIGILVGLLLPATNMVREAARRTICSNNLHQIGAAFRQYESKFSMLPDGGFLEWGNLGQRSVKNGVPCTAGHQAWAWGYQILPMIDQQALWSLPGNINDPVIFSTPIATYFCPSTRRPIAMCKESGETPAQVLQWEAYGVLFPIALGDYAGNAGVSNYSPAPADKWSGQGNGVFGDGSVDGIVIKQTSYDTATAANPQGRVAAVTSAGIKGGAQYTLMVGEKLMNWDTCKSTGTGSDNAGYCATFQDDVVRWSGGYAPCSSMTPIIIPPTPHYTSASKSDYATHGEAPLNMQWGSPHASGCQFVMCDGSVRTISYGIDLTTFRHLSQRVRHLHGFSTFNGKANVNAVEPDDPDWLLPIDPSKL